MKDLLKKIKPTSTHLTFLGHGIELHYVKYFEKLLITIIFEFRFDMYLRDRRPVAYTHNPGLSLADDPRPEFNRYKHEL